ncbi:hypothetical protein [Streptomyces paromomycinus]|uniref:Uncharacterized protein n=1 Tax=Streptomyces paromomycinus TaxID=92743 RepID=A0A401VVK5_STREY|nr:hypothetical protein [Streptomyces paromomycinus]GCD41110.1 hypothetical protein GKJPGBOP_00763 [Streptomyces paromomycinus]
MADDDVRRRLREAAQDHGPDRARMLARLERGMAGATQAGAEPRRRAAPGGSWPRVALAAATVGALVAGGYAVATAVQSPDAGPGRVTTRPVAPAGPGEERPASPTPPPGPSATPAEPPSGNPGRTARPGGPTGGTRSGGRTGGPSTPPAPGASSGARPPSGGTGDAPRTEDGTLWSDGSVDPHSNIYWAQSNVTLQTEQPLTALTVELRIAQTGGVADTGHWSTLPPNDFAVSVEEHDGALVYRWKLKPGRTVPAGRHVFAGQYNHAAGGRDAKDDSYTATAQAPGGGLRVRGAF